MEQSITDDGDYSKYIASAKAFLKSLKPKVYVCAINSQNEIVFVTEFNVIPQFSNNIENAMTFESLDKAKNIKDEILELFDLTNFFILTE